MKLIAAQGSANVSSKIPSIDFSRDYHFLAHASLFFEDLLDVEDETIHDGEFSDPDEECSDPELELFPDDQYANMKLRKAGTTENRTCGGKSSAGAVFKKT